VHAFQKHPVDAFIHNYNGLEFTVVYNLNTNSIIIVFALQTHSTNMNAIRTYNCKMYEVAKVRRGRHLALVDTGVPVLGILDLKSPVFGVRLMYRPETLVASVGVPAHRQEMDVAVPHPRHLQRHLQWSDSSTPSFGGSVHSLTLTRAVKCRSRSAFGNMHALP
jgi:hypothetical protein